MPNINYIRGRAREYKIKKNFEETGFIVLRTAGSHGFADLIAVNKETKQIIFIQVKPKNYSQKEIDKQEKDYKWINNFFMCNFVVLS